MIPNVQLLQNAAEQSPEITLFILLFTIVLLVTVLIYRWGWFDEDGNDRVTYQTPMAAMEKVHNPFIINLKDEQNCSFQNGVTLTLTSLVPCCVRCYWGTLIEDIYPLIYQRWELLHHMLLEDTLTDFSLQHSHQYFIEPVDNKIVPVAPPSGDLSRDLGQPPRSRYPLVVVVCDQQVLEMAAGEDVQNNKVICCIGIFHIKDEVCRGPSHAIAQYVRTPHGRPCNLTPMFVSTDDNPEVAHQTSSSSSCVVCISSAVDRVFLPCRHACVCDACSTRLSHCPMCRTGISSTFLLDS